MSLPWTIIDHQYNSAVLLVFLLPVFSATAEMAPNGVFFSLYVQFVHLQDLENKIKENPVEEVGHHGKWHREMCNCAKNKRQVYQ